MFHFDASKRGDVMLSTTIPEFPGLDPCLVGLIYSQRSIDITPRRAGLLVLHRRFLQTGRPLILHKGKHCGIGGAE